MVSDLGSAISAAVQEQIRQSLVTSARPDWVNEIVDFTGEMDFSFVEDEIRRIANEIVSSQQGGTSDSSVQKEMDKISAAEDGLFKKQQEIEKQQKALTAKIQEQDKKMIELFKGIKDPKGKAENILMDGLNKVPVAKAALRMIPIISAVLAAPEIVNLIVKILISPGGPFDRRLRIVLEEQEQAFLDRQAQKRRQLGLDQVVIPLDGTFGNAGGRMSTNSLNKVGATGTSGIGLKELGMGMKE